MNFWKILGFLGNLFLKIDLGISFKLFRPLAGWIRDITGASQWTMARQALMGAGLTTVIYYIYQVLTSSPWYWLMIVWIIFWLGKLEVAKIRKYEASESGPLEAMISDQFMRSWFLSFTVIFPFGPLIGHKAFGWPEWLAFSSFVLLICNYYFRTVFMPPPRKRREEMIKEAFA